MIVIRATEEGLASLLFLDKRLEEYPEPYRSNGDMEIQVSLDVYRNFVDKYLEGHDYLSTATPILKYTLSLGNDEAFCKCFYKDMALAIIKELWYTDVTGVPTTITHSVGNAKYYDKQYIIDLWEQYPKELSQAQNKLLSHMKSANYQLSVQKVVKFGEQLQYATVLYAMSSIENEYIDFAYWNFERRFSHDA